MDSKVQSENADVASIPCNEASVFLKDSTTAIQQYTMQEYLPRFSSSLQLEGQFLNKTDKLIANFEEREKGLMEQKNAMLQKLEAVSRSLRPQKTQ